MPLAAGGASILCFLLSCWGRPPRLYTFGVGWGFSPSTSSHQGLFYIQARADRKHVHISLQKKVGGAVHARVAMGAALLAVPVRAPFRSSPAALLRSTTRLCRPVRMAAYAAATKLSQVSSHPAPHQPRLRTSEHWANAIDSTHHDEHVCAGAG